MRFSRVLLLSVALFFCLNAAQAQTVDWHWVTIIINPVAALAVAGGNITLTVLAPATGGQAPANPTNSTCYLQYTSSLATGQTRTVTAAWGGADAAPAGCSLLLQASPTGGAEGSTAGQKTISSIAQIMITGISRCATGTGATDGANLAYTLSIDTFTSLVAGESQSATLTFTLTDAS